MHRRRRYGERLGLAERVVAERKRRGLRQIDAAREIGVSRETLALVEVHHIPSRATKAKINGWMAAPPVNAERAADLPPVVKPAAPPGGLAGKPAARRLGVLVGLAIRRRAARAFRRTEAARAKGGKGKKAGKGRRGESGRR